MEVRRAHDRRQRFRPRKQARRATQPEAALRRAGLEIETEARAEQDEILAQSQIQVVSLRIKRHALRRRIVGQRHVEHAIRRRRVRHGQRSVAAEGCDARRRSGDVDAHLQLRLSEWQRRAHRSGDVISQRAVQARLGNLEEQVRVHLGELHPPAEAALQEASLPVVAKAAEEARDLDVARQRHNDILMREDVRQQIAERARHAARRKQRRITRLLFRRAQTRI